MNSLPYELIDTIYRLVLSASEGRRRLICRKSFIRLDKCHTKFANTLKRNCIRVICHWQDFRRITVEVRPGVTRITHRVIPQYSEFRICKCSSMRCCTGVHSIDNKFLGIEDMFNDVIGRGLIQDYFSPTNIPEAGFLKMNVISLIMYKLTGRASNYWYSKRKINQVGKMFTKSGGTFEVIKNPTFNLRYHSPLGRKIGILVKSSRIRTRGFNKASTKRKKMLQSFANDFRESTILIELKGNNIMFIKLFKDLSFLLTGS